MLSIKLKYTYTYPFLPIDFFRFPSEKLYQIYAQLKKKTGVIIYRKKNIKLKQNYQ